MDLMDQQEDQEEEESGGCRRVAMDSLLPNWELKFGETAPGEEMVRRFWRR